MKSKNNKKNKNLFVGIGFISLMMMSPLVMSQDYAYDADMVLNSEQIDIDGLYQERRQETAAERATKERNKLIEQNNQMMQKKIEDMRTQEERKLTKKLQNAFSGKMNQLNDNSNNQLSNQLSNQMMPNNQMDRVNVSQAAVMQASIQPVKAPRGLNKPSKLIPTVGAASYKGTKVDYETKTNLGLNFEQQLSERFSVGFGASYSAMEITDTGSQYVSYTYNNFNFNPYYNNLYNTTFGKGREMKFTKWNLELNSKFFVLGTDSRIRPYLGVGLGYNRISLEYLDNGMGYNFNNINFGNEGHTSNFMSGRVMLGSEVAFTDSIGMVLDLSFAKAFTNGFSTNSNASWQNPDQIRLENFNKDIEDASILAVNLGFVVRF